MTLPSYNSIRQTVAEVTTTEQQRRKGLGLAALSAVAFAAMTLLVRVLSDAGFSPLQIMAWRGAVQAVCALGTCAVLRVNPFKVDSGWKRFRWVCVRAVFGWIGHLLYYAALSRLSMGVATVLFFTNPVFTAVLAHCMLDERFTGDQRWLMGVSLFGIVLVVAPLSPLALIGVGVSRWSLAALLGAASVALAYVSVRVAGPRVHPLIHVVYFSVVAAVGSTLLAFIQGENWHLPAATATAWLSVIGVGVCAFLAQYLMGSGLLLASAGPVVMMRNSDIVISFVLDAALFHTWPSASSVIGAIIITICMVKISLSTQS
ncbi:hypothetical protein IWW55_001114 [Coemansia sp. RSA 2706]|nr:hypothetical protein IWW55_001114 [Coemansia sp. RSA 2706]KAJ2308589.1 hypothetical protein IWW54_004034 [Coemansia sp. RSA 2705]KAJ2319949.1 hypothetical protein IWW52_001667 [Coemansia sp. RSA 2704]KAJ2326008.1 hypothetical protein IWW51_002502 [Coemansia sp. RSA 2702]KAJ2367309.1 hypothetical protein H4S01_002230 [Coemansia sp. RSA 2610]